MNKEQYYETMRILNIDIYYRVLEKIMNYKGEVDIVILGKKLFTVLEPYMNYITETGYMRGGEMFPYWVYYEKEYIDDWSMTVGNRNTGNITKLHLDAE